MVHFPELELLGIHTMCCVLDSIISKTDKRTGTVVVQRTVIFFTKTRCDQEKNGYRSMFSIPANGGGEG